MTAVFTLAVMAWSVSLVALASGAGAQTDGATGLTEPVAGQVVDRFRPPAHVGAPGNRGWEYRTAPGSPVVAAADGIVAFAGPIGGRLYVSIDHPNGLRTTYSLLESISVEAGEPIPRGGHVGTTGAVFHFGAHRGRAYVDPALLFGGGVSARVRLVPVSRGYYVQ